MPFYMVCLVWFERYGVSICVMTRIFRGQITRKIQDFFYKEMSNFLGNLTPKNTGHDADQDTISLRNLSLTDF